MALDAFPKTATFHWSFPLRQEGQNAHVAPPPPGVAGFRCSSARRSSRRASAGSRPRRHRRAPTTTPRSSRSGTRSPSAPSSSTRARRTPRRSSGTPTNRPRSTTRSSGSQGATRRTGGLPKPPTTRRRRPPPPTAAFRVLLTYFPGSQTRLDTAYQASLDQIPDGTAKTRGHQLRGARGRPHHRHPGQRRPFRRRQVQAAAGPRRVASDPARVHPVLRPVAGARCARSPSTRTTSSSRAHRPH